MAGMKVIKDIQHRAGRRERCTECALLFGYPKCLFFKYNGKLLMSFKKVGSNVENELGEQQEWKPIIKMFP